MKFNPKKLSTRDEIQFQAVRAKGTAAVERFVQMLKDGQSVSMAAMLATQSPPRTGICDQVYQKNRRSLLDQCDGSPIVLKAWRDGYRRRTGEELPSDAVLFRGLAREPGDPEAILTHKHSLQDMQQSLRSRGVRVEGEDWEIEPEPTPPVVQEITIGEDLIQRYMAEDVMDDPSLGELPAQELREKVIAEHGRKVTQSDLSPYGASTFSELAEKVFGTKSKRKKGVKKNVHAG